MVFLDVQNDLKLYHKMQIDRERLRPAVTRILIRIGILTCLFHKTRLLVTLKHVKSEAAGFAQFF